MVARVNLPVNCARCGVIYQMVWMARAPSSHQERIAPVVLLTRSATRSCGTWKRGCVWYSSRIQGRVWPRVDRASRFQRFPELEKGSDNQINSKPRS
jgi:hypothetical protein